MATHDSNVNIKFADDSAVVEPISNNDEQSYLEEVENPTQWCQLNKLSLNVGKTKDLVVDFEKKNKRSYSTFFPLGPVD